MQSNVWFGIIYLDQIYQLDLIYQFCQFLRNPSLRYTRKISSVKEIIETNNYLFIELGKYLICNLEV